MKTLKVMAVAFERPIPMRILIDCFLVQTNPNWELLIVHDGVASKAVREVAYNYADEPRVRYFETFKRKQQYGHPNRQTYLKSIEYSEDEFILLTNDDNFYCPVYVQYMLESIQENTGMVYCDTVHSHFKYNVLKTLVAVDHIDIGSFIVRADIAKAVGFNHFEFNGDGMYAEECKKLCIERGLRVDYVPKPIFIHN